MILEERALALFKHGYDKTDADYSYAVTIVRSSSTVLQMVVRVAISSMWCSISIGGEQTEVHL